MAPQLHFLGKKLFMEYMLTDHGHKKHKCFLESLLINKHFLNIARNHRIYKISALPFTEESNYLNFKSYTGCSRRCYGISTFEFFCCVLKLLKPSFTEFDYNDTYNQKRFNVDILLALMQLASANGKVSLRINRYGEIDFSNVLNHVYEYVDELTCYSILLPKADKVKFKLLDKLEVSYIRSNEQLNAVLKHSAVRLDLTLYANLEGDESVQLYNNDAKQCKLFFGLVKDADQPCLVIRHILNVCKQLEALDIGYYMYSYDVTDFATFLNGISHQYELFTKLIETIRQLSPNLVLNVTLEICQAWFEIKTELPEDWQQQVKQINGLQNAEIEETLEEEDNRSVKSIKVTSGNRFTNAKFSFKFFGD